MRIRLSNKVEELLKAFVVENQLEGVALSYLAQSLVIEAINNNKKHREGQHNDLQRKNRKLFR
jgi:hypothetical protein